MVFPMFQYSEEAGSNGLPKTVSLQRKLLASKMAKDMTKHNTSTARQGDVLSESEIISETSACRKQIFVYMLAIVCVLVFIVHIPSLSARATFHDDQMYVTDNTLVQNPGWASARRFFAEVLKPSTVRGYYQPLTMISLMADIAITGRFNSFRAFHRTSLLLHIANTALVAVLLYSLFGHALIAAGVALLFGLHPMTVDSICWISERKTVLATFFALLSLISYVRFARFGKKRYFSGCVVAYMVALLAKPITVPLPAMMLLMDYWPLDRIRWKTVLEKLPLFLIGTMFAVITYVSQSRTTLVILPGQYNPLRIPLILSHNIIFYLYKIVWPLNLSAHYENTSYLMKLAGVIGTCILIPILVISLRRTRGLLTGWLFFFVAILPSMGIISVTPVIAANRYAYLPCIGLLMLIASFLVWFRSAAYFGRPITRNLVAIIAVLILAGAESMATRRYLNNWRDTISLYEYMLTICPRSAVLHSDLGAVLSRIGRREEAISHYQQALEISPRYTLAHFNLAVEFGNIEEKTDQAIEHYRKVLEIDPSYYQAHLNLGNMLVSKGEFDKAINHYRKAVQINPKFVMGYYNLGKSLVVADHPKEGFDNLREAIRLGPGFVTGMKELAWFLATHPDPEVRDADEALRIAECASEMTKNRNPAALDTLAAAYAARGQFSLAASLAERALTFSSRTRDEEFAKQISERLELYKHRKPFIQNPREQIKQLLPAVSKDKSEPENENIEEASL